MGKVEVIKSRLGYRYQVLNVAYPSEVVAGATVTLGVTVQNSGFAKIPAERSAYLAAWAREPRGGREQSRL